MTNENLTNRSRYKLALIPASVMGIATNLYISVVIYLVGSYTLVLSPLLGTIFFVYMYWALKNEKVHPKKLFLQASLVVLTEIAIHSHFLGWDCGFYYYAFLLPLVFLLNSDWRNWMIVLFNGGIIVFTVVLWHFQTDKPGYYEISFDVQSVLKFINLGGTGFIVVVIMLYFSKTLNRKDEELIQVNRALETQNKEIRAQNEHKEILLKEIHHRVKNNLQIISSLISLQRRIVDDEQILTVLDESRRRVEAIASIHQKLYLDEDITQVNFRSYLEDILRSQQEINPEVDCELYSDEVILSLDVAVPMGLVVSEMISNAFKHAFNGVENPKLFISMYQNEEDDYTLVIKDNGVGLPENFEIAEDGSLGTEIIEALTSQINATVEFFNDCGANFKITFQDK